MHFFKQINVGKARKRARVYPGLIARLMISALHRAPMAKISEPTLLSMHEFKLSNLSLICLGRFSRSIDSKYAVSYVRRDSIKLL